jgi:YVTN family beta-propeller protein
VVDTIRLGEGGLQPISIAVDPTTGLAYAATVRSSSLTVFDPGLGVTLASVDLTSQPRAVAVNPATLRVYVTETANALTVIDAVSYEVIARVVLGEAPERGGIGNGLWGVAMSPSTNRVYVASQSADSLLVLDATTHAVLAEVPMRAPWGVAVNEATNRVYVVARNDLVVLDGVTDTVVATVTVAEAPHIACLSGETGLAVDPVANRIYVGSLCAGPGTVNLPFGPPSAFGPGIIVVDGETHTVENTILFQFRGSHVAGLAVNPTLGHVYVPQGRNLAVVDGRAGVLLGTITLGEDRPGGGMVFGNTNQVAVDPLAGRVLVARQAENAVVVVDAATLEVDGKVPMGRAPRALAINPRTNTIYVASSETHAVLAVDGFTGDLTAELPASRAGAVAVNPLTNRIYARAGGTGGVAVYDGATHSVVANVPTDMFVDRSCSAYPEALAINSRTDRVYVGSMCRSGMFVVNGASNEAEYVDLGISPSALDVDLTANRVYAAGSNLTVVDGESHRIVGTVPLPANAWSRDVAVDATAGRVYVLNAFEGGARTVAVVDNRTLAVLATVAVERSAASVALNPEANRLFITNPGDHTVSELDTLTLRTVGSVAVGRKPGAVAVHPSTGQLLVANELGDSISVVE